MGLHIVMVSSESMPSKVKAKYVKVALIELEPGHEETRPTMISERARGIRRILEVRRRLHMGSNPRGHTAAELAIAELKARADELNTCEAIGLPITPPS